MVKNELQPDLLERRGGNVGGQGTIKEPGGKRGSLEEENLKA